MSERAVEELANYWDALTLGRDVEAPAVDPSLAMAVLHFQRAVDVPAPDLDFVARLERELVQSGDSAVARPPVVVRLHPRASAEWEQARPSTTSRSTGARDGRWAAHLATAAMLLLTLAGGFLAIRGVAPAPRAVPVGWALDATSDPAAVTGLLARTTVVVAPSVPGYIGVERWRFSPRSGQLASGPLSGPSLFYVTAGRLSATLVGGGRVARGVGASQSAAVASGVPIELAAGDSLTVPANVGFVIANDQSTPASVLAFYVLKATATDNQGPTYDDRLIQNEMLASDNPGIAFPAGPMRIELRRTTLAPGASLPAPQTGGYQMVAGETKALAYLVRDAGGRVTNKETEPVGVVVVTMRPAAPDLTAAGPSPQAFARPAL
ncbi:MAG TPA: hypothetical protein VFU81_14190 [Thermomicrobiales bacterium]|nr:hypothetical protein [Thermomicrobiales bacterium]